MIATVLRYDGDGSSWDAFVASHPESSNYHRFGWKRVIEQSFGHPTYYLTALDEHGAIRGVLPLVHMKSALFGSFLVSLPFFNYGGMLCSDAEAEALLLDNLKSLAASSGAEHAELRHLRLAPGDLVTRQHKVTMLLELAADEESQWKALGSKVRNQVRKAQKSDLQTLSGGMELLDGFYEVFSRNMRDLGTPVYSRDFFTAILETFPESTRIVSVQLQGRTIASALLTWQRDTLEVPWASSVRDYRELCPNNLLYWEAIRFALGIGARVFDFGRSTPGEGTYAFKKQWGAEPRQLYWQYLLLHGKPLPQLSPANSKYRAAISVWQKLPLCVTNLLGPAIVRNIP